MLVASGPVPTTAPSTRTRAPGGAAISMRPYPEGTSAPGGTSSGCGDEALGTAAAPVTAALGTAAAPVTAEAVTVMTLAGEADGAGSVDGAGLAGSPASPPLIPSAAEIPTPRTAKAINTNTSRPRDAVLGGR